MQDYKIRFYEKTKDFDAAVAAGAEFSKEKDIAFDADSFAHYVDSMEKTGAIIVAESPEGEPVGFLALVEIKNPFTGKQRIHQSDLFVSEGHRNKGVTKKLRERARACGELIGIEEYSWE